MGIYFVTVKHYQQEARSINDCGLFVCPEALKTNYKKLEKISLWLLAWLLENWAFMIIKTPGPHKRVSAHILKNSVTEWACLPLFFTLLSRFRHSRCPLPPPQPTPRRSRMGALESFFQLMFFISLSPFVFPELSSSP